MSVGLDPSSPVSSVLLLRLLWFFFFRQFVLLEKKKFFRQSDSPIWPGFGTLAPAAVAAACRSMCGCTGEFMGIEDPMRVFRNRDFKKILETF